YRNAVVFRRDANSVPIQFLATGRDITEHRLSQNALSDLLDNLATRVAERTGALESANRALRDTEQELRHSHDDLVRRVHERTADRNAAVEELKMFAFIVSHDLRAPLVNLKGFSQELALTLDTLRDSMGKVLPYCEPDVQSSIRNALFTETPEFIKYI